MPLPPENSDVNLLLQTLQGDRASSATADFLPLYRELRTIAGALMRSEDPAHTLQATALVHEAWLRLFCRTEPRWHDRHHLVRTAALAMRHLLVEHARRRTRLKRGGGVDPTPLDETDVSFTAPPERWLQVNAALERFALEDPASAQVVELKFFCHYTTQEIARYLGCSERHVERTWTYARARLGQLLRDEP